MAYLLEESKKKKKSFVLCNISDLGFHYSYSQIAMQMYYYTITYFVCKKA